MASDFSSLNLVMAGATIAIGAALYRVMERVRAVELKGALELENLQALRSGVSKLPPGDQYSQFWQRFWQQGEATTTKHGDFEFLVSLAPAVPHIERIMVRDAYTHALKFLEDDTMNDREGAVIVSGHPGIGKTLFLWYILCLRLADKKPTILQKEPSQFYLFDESGVRQLQATISDRELALVVPDGTWALVDSNPVVISPAPAIQTCFRAFVVVAASPRKERMDWTRARLPHVVQRYYMEPWTLKELLAALPYQRLSRTPTEEQLRSFYDLYGPSARDAYTSAWNLHGYNDTLRRAIDDLTSAAIEKALHHPDLDAIAMKESHKVLLVRPFPQVDFEELVKLGRGTSPTENRHMKMSVSIISKHVTDLLWKAHDGQIRDKLVEYLKMLLYDPAGKARAGPIFERAVHSVLSNGGEFQLFQMTAKAHPKNALWAKSGPSQAYTLPARSSKHFPDVKKLDTLDNKEYYQPIASNNPTFDSFVCDDSVVTLFQSTVSDTHDVKMQGVRDIQNVRNKLRQNARLQYVVVTPMQQDIKISMPLDVYDVLRQEKTSFEMWAMVVGIERIDAGCNTR